MAEQPQNIRDEHLFKFASAKRYLKIFVPDFAFSHDDKHDDRHRHNRHGKPEVKDKFVGREIQMRKLFTWLTSESKSGSYLITGYRGMGKSLLVKRVVEQITREPKAYKEVLFQVAMVLTIAACFFGIAKSQWYKLGLYFYSDWDFAYPLAFSLLGCAILIIALLELSKYWNYVVHELDLMDLPMRRLFSKDMLSKVWRKMRDGRRRNYSTIAVTINLGQEVLNERDVLSLITQNVRERYAKYVHDRQNRPFFSYALFAGVCAATFAAIRFILYPALSSLADELLVNLGSLGDNLTWFPATLYSFLEWIKILLDKGGPESFFALLSIFILIYYLVLKIGKSLRKYVPFFSLPYLSLEKLDTLCERISSSFNEEMGTHPQYSSSFFNFSFGKEGKSKSTPKATVRELEQELLSIINDINGRDCPADYRVQFIFVFDELDKITSDSPQSDRKRTTDEESAPEFDASVKGFSDTSAFEERKQNVLRLLANMKLFIASVKAKCVFISGHELFDASLADLSDREFAISSVFNGVLNVSSFLSPERYQSDVSSMTEVYLASMLLPVSYLKRRIKENVLDNGVLKDELPSLRWYNEYLMELHVLKNKHLKTEEEALQKEDEIRHVMEFLRSFSVFLSHISNGSPKKIASYFEKYIKLNYDAIGQFDWYDVIVVGEPTEKDVKNQCVLLFDLEDQKLINFIHYFAAPVMNGITNEVSHYGDKLLVSSSFMLDHIYKYHGKGFSWRNLEQMPELLNLNKNPELRDSMASIMEFLLQTHVTPITSGVFQYKFHKQIAEEISILSKTSDEAAAIFNFTLNETATVKRYNTRLLWHYVGLSQDLKDGNRYNNVLERLHENLGDIYFSEEDYYRAVHEYRSALQCMSKEITAHNILPYLMCSLKIGISYEYRRTFENAFMVYCEIINKLIHLRWFDERILGLDYTMRLTKDQLVNWPLKKVVYVDEETIQSVFGTTKDDKFRRQFQPGLMEDLMNDPYFHPTFSIDSDQTISAFAADYTPEKSDILFNLTSFEDVKYIYQALIARLFVIEKMGVSGITQSSIDAAEADFFTLYSATNHHEKFILAVDFFTKLAAILYYKNNYVSAAPVENLTSLLYVFDMNVLAFLDDFCYSLNQSSSTAINVIEVKDAVRDFFGKQKIRFVNDKLVIGKNARELKTFSGLKSSTSHNSNPDYVKEYLKYLDGLKVFNLTKIKTRLPDCAERRSKLSKTGHRLPCNACKYANRSMGILMDRLFTDKPVRKPGERVDQSKVLSLLRNTSHKYLHYLRREHVSALAYSAEQMGDIMLSCACTNRHDGDDRADQLDLISVKTIHLLAELSYTVVDEEKRIKKINDYKASMEKIGKLDRVLLYYWSACRYYEIASMYQEASHCLLRIAKVIEDYLTVISVKQKLEMEDEDTLKELIEGLGRMSSPMSDSHDSIPVLTALLDNLFMHACRMVGRQYNNFNMVEIHETKWTLHLEHTDKIDLTKLAQFPNVQSLFLSLVRSKVLFYQLTGCKDYQDYITKVYNRVAPSLRHERTFKSEVEQNYTKAVLNRTILVDLLGKDVMMDFRAGVIDLKHKGEYHLSFLVYMYGYLKAGKPKVYEEKLFKTSNSVQSRLDLLDYLVFDSLVCLCNIIRILPPHNQVTTFSNSFIADVYENLWEWSKYYEMLYDIYMYYRYFNEGDMMGKESIAALFTRLATNAVQAEDFLETLEVCASTLQDKGVVFKDDFGYRYSKLFMNIRHEVDDSTIHHVDTNYSAEMAIKYYRAARSINSEGMEYKNLIYGMNALDDDLRNDTCQSNLADERYMLNSGILSIRRKKLQIMYQDTTINVVNSYEEWTDPARTAGSIERAQNRFEDSVFTNTEY